jgi:glycosyltransferase involved in cell wall biosynthesis
MALSVLPCPGGPGAAQESAWNGEREAETGKLDLPHVLVIPSWYPTEESPVNGVFFREQTQAYHDLGAKVGVIFPEHRSIRQLRPAALKRNHFQVVEEDDEGVPTLREKGWNPFVRMNLGGRFWVSEAKSLYSRYVRKYGRPDVIHAHSILWGGVAASSISRVTHTPFVVTEHSSAFARSLLTPSQTAIAREAVRNAKRIVCVGTELKKLLLEKGVVSPDIVEVVPNLVNTEFFTLPPEPRTQPPFRFLSVSLLLPNKGFDDLLNAFALAFKGREDVVLEIGGNGADRARLEKITDELGIRRQVRFLGMLDKTGVRDALWRANGLVHASFYETFGVILIEALSTGLPCLATACGGPQDIISEDCGLLVPIKDPAMLAAGMKSLMLRHFDPGVLRDHAKERFAMDVVAKQLADVYRRARGPI